MSKADKLKEKLANGTIDARELRTLLIKMGWYMVRQNGSHEQWTNDVNVLTLATHGNELKRYQIKQAQDALNINRRTEP